MDLAERFRRAVTTAYDAAAASAELVPMVLSQACVAVLPVAGAGLSITDELRIPLGASDPDASRAEQIQTTLGEGPCLAATASQQPVTADQTTIATRWPVFHGRFVSETPYRSAVSVPLLSRDRQLHLGALDLYLTISEPVPDFFVRQVTGSIATTIASVLFDQPGTARGHDTLLPPWLDSVGVRQRMHVWVAVGILIEHAALSNLDALAALRAYAFAHDADLDTTAEQLMQRRLEPAAVLP